MENMRPIPWPAGAPTLAPGQGIKFAVVDGLTGRRSSTWRLGTARNHDDIYLLELRTGPTWKVSHHNEGAVWRIAMTREGALRLDSDRAVVDQWESHTPPGGWREGVGILVPMAYMRPQPEPLSPSVRQIPVSPEHSAIKIRLLFEETEARGTVVPEAFPVALLHRSNGGRAYVVAVPQTLGHEQRVALAAICADARAARSAGEDLDGWNRFVGVFQVGEKRVLADLAID